MNKKEDKPKETKRKTPGKNGGRQEAALLSDILPLPEPRFGGRVGNTYADSEADLISLPRAPAGAPNVLLVLLDDVGFGQSSTFGGPVNTPTLQKLADDGLRFNRFHTTALCSPTRAALLSGRNHHSVHTGCITELATGFPGYDGQWPKEAASVAEVLRSNRYATAAFGKWHNTPDHELGVGGPYERWPSGKGFDYFYGFQGGESNQWFTPLFENTAPIEMPHDNPKWHLSEALAERAIGWIGQQKAVAPDTPFFIYFAPGAAHAPHHVSKEWADKYKGKFDQGWDKQRELTFENQKKLGIIPKDTKLTPRPDSIPSWDSRSADEKRLYARMQEVFAGFLEHVDAQVGKVVDAIDQMGLRDDTLIIYIVGDNGPSAEGTLAGTLNVMRTMLGLEDDPSEMVKHIDEIGGPQFENHYPVGWCWAGSSPFQWMKQVASHFGGTRNGLVMSWPKGIKDRGGLRSQFHHVIDIAPTILDIAGIPEPREVNGVAQKPIEGISMAYTFDDRDAAGRRITQYFEMFGNRALYHDGWVAGCLHGKAPWITAGSVSFDSDKWELYKANNHYAVGWAHALNTPYQWTKQVASHFGGTRNGAIVHWPKGIKAKGQVRSQFHHVIDVAPTILDAARLPEPTYVHGVMQEPMHGVSMRYSFDDAKAAERHETQYFEMLCNRGIYHKGWTAVTHHGGPPWIVTGKQPPLNDDVWELYDTTKDWSQARDLAKQMPDKLEEMKRLFELEASKYNVFPLDDRKAERANPDIAGRPAVVQGSSQLLFANMRRIQENAVINTKNKSHSVSAEIEVPKEGATGVIVAQGGAMGGWALYAHDGLLKYAYTFLGIQHTTIGATSTLPAGTHQVRMEFTMASQ
jgi:arylsulfatase A-like enzyme